ncbi:MAG: hypothetical protein HPY66_3601 [Firmicutes bacterium]|nr:hypothetical protein [Bacillota bacterium]
MDFDDILRILIYILIPVFLTMRKRAANSNRKRENDPRQAPKRTTGRSLMDRLESMVSEMEKKAEGMEKRVDGNASSSPRRPRTPARPEQRRSIEAADTLRRDVDWQDVYTGAEGPLDQVDLQSVYTSSLSVQEQPKPDKKADRKKDKASPLEEPVQSREAWSFGSFDAEDILKGIVLSEILQPPVSRRQYKRHL